ncbi:MAG: DUF2796 domain-containing protein [Gammaproteobacteria bacterium]|nr:DUF2796 domain-containing protein [Gammaproteobacteria bacterium]
MAIISTPSIAQITKQLDAHSHGEAQISIAIDGDQIFLTLVSPAANLVGFEHSPKNAEQREHADTTQHTLSDYTNLYELPADTNCEVAEKSVQWTFDRDSNNEKHTEHADTPSGHSEFEAEFLLTCENSAGINTIGVRLFEQFPAIERIRVEVLFDSSQIVEVLTPAKNTVKLAR